jgi:hypothetical protein
VRALLRQPHGFEGLALAGVDAPPDALATSEPSYLPGRGVDRRITPRAATPQAEHREGHISEIAQFADLRAEVGERPEQARPPAADFVVAVVAALHPGQDREGLHVVIQHRQQTVEVAVLERLKRAAVNSTFSCDIACAVSRLGAGAQCLLGGFLPPVATKLTQSPWFLNTP